MKKTILLAAALAAGNSLAQQQTEGVEPYIEYKKRVETAQNISPLDNGMFGESTSLYNGSTTFKVVDIDLPGNNGLPVQLARTLSVDIQPQGTAGAYDTLLRGIGNWQVDVPHIAATYPQNTGWNSTRCSVGSVPGITAGPGGYFLRSEYWSGISINVPGRGGTSALGLTAQVPKPTTGATYKLTTTERDMIDCIPMKSGLAGEGFRMTTTAGVKYYFDVGTVRTASTLERRVMSQYLAEDTLLFPRNRYYLMASKIEDPFGNTVNFEYNAAGHPTRIWSSDGREIQLTYTSGRLATAAADGRVWQYEYSPNAYADPNPDLVRVILPDASRWQYSYTGTLKPDTGFPSDSLYLPWCMGTTSIIDQAFSVSATHPSGAVGEFDFANLRHYRSGVHATECLLGGNSATPEYKLLTPYYFDVMSLTGKRISGPGVPLKSWAYDYGVGIETFWGSPTQQPAYPCTTCTVEKAVVVTNPDGSKRRHRFGKMYRFNEGRMLGTDVLTANHTVLSAESSVYLADAQAASQLFFGSYGTVLGGISDPVAALVRPVVTRTTTQQGRNFTWRVDNTCGTNGTTYCFDSLARPTKVVRSSAQP